MYYCTVYIILFLTKNFNDKMGIKNFEPCLLVSYFATVKCICKCEYFYISNEYLYMTMNSRFRSTSIRVMLPFAPCRRDSATWFAGDEGSRQRTRAPAGPWSSAEECACALCSRHSGPPVDWSVEQRGSQKPSPQHGISIKSTFFF